MTQPPKEKAKELVDKFKPHSRIKSSGFLVSNEDTLIKSAKQCALIAVQFAEKQLIEYGNQTFELQNMDSTFRDLDTLKTEIQNL